MQAQAEPVEGLVAILSSTSFGGSAQFEHELMFHGELTTLNPESTLEARLAAQVPSLNDGTWKVFDDGRMELTWTLRPTLWHDGTPLTADDFVFGTTVARDPALATTTRARAGRARSRRSSPPIRTPSWCAIQSRT